MAAKQCPKCLMWVTDEERMSGQCPGCKSFFESELPGSATSTSHAAPGVPLINTHAPESPTARVKRGASAWHAWWLIPLVLIGMRACRAVMRSTENRTSQPTYEQFDRDSMNFNFEDHERLRQLLEQAREERPTNEFRMGPDPGFEPATPSTDPFDVELPDTDPFKKLNLPPGFEPPNQHFDN